MADFRTKSPKGVECIAIIDGTAERDKNGNIKGYNVVFQTNESQYSYGDISKHKTQENPYLAMNRKGREAYDNSVMITPNQLNALREAIGNNYFRGDGTYPTQTNAIYGAFKADVTVPVSVPSRDPSGEIITGDDGKPVMKNIGRMPNSKTFQPSDLYSDGHHFGFEDFQHHVNIVKSTNSERDAKRNGIREKYSFEPTIEGKEDTYLKEITIGEFTELYDSDKAVFQVKSVALNDKGNADIYDTRYFAVRREYPHDRAMTKEEFETDAGLVHDATKDIVRNMRDVLQEEKSDSLTWNTIDCNVKNVNFKEQNAVICRDETRDFGQIAAVRSIDIGNNLRLQPVFAGKSGEDDRAEKMEEVFQTESDRNKNVLFKTTGEYTIHAQGYANLKGVGFNLGSESERIDNLHTYYALVHSDTERPVRISELDDATKKAVSKKLPEALAESENVFETAKTLNLNVENMYGSRNPNMGVYKTITDSDTKISSNVEGFDMSSKDIKAKTAAPAKTIDEKINQIEQSGLSVSDKTNETKSFDVDGASV